MSKCVLVVDDDPDILEYVSVLLSDNGFEVRQADSAATATAALDAGPADLLLVDVLLQGRSGLDLMLSVRGDPRFGDLPVVLLTGDDGVLADQGRSYHTGNNEARRGPDAVLAKPLVPEQLLSTLERLLGGTG